MDICVCERECVYFSRAFFSPLVGWLVGWLVGRNGA